MSAPIITESEIRAWICDTAKDNTLVNGVRFSSSQIEAACINVVDCFNISNPPTPNFYSVESFPYRYLLLIGVAGYLLKGAAVGEFSNEFQYSADSVTVTDRSRGPVFADLGAKFWAEFKEMTKDIKLTQNIARTYGHKFSEYITRVR